MKSKINLHIYPNNIIKETRIFKQTDSIIRLTPIDKIIIIGIGDGVLPNFQDLDEYRKIRRLNLFMTRFKKSKLVDALKVLEFYLKILLYFSRTKPIYVNCHSLSVLPIAPFFKILCGSKIIYDTHELETHKFGIGKRLQFVISKVEKAFVYFVDHIVVVSNSIGIWYQKAYPTKSISIVRNIPVNKLLLDNSDQKSDYLREKFNIPSDHIIFIYQGIISKERGVRTLLEVFSKVRSDLHIVFMGFGIDTDIVKQKAAEKVNIHFHEAVNQSEMKKITSSADVGFSVLANDCLNHYFCLPNKVFEYIQSDIPVIASNFPDLKQFVKENEFGWVCEPTFEGIKVIVSTITKKDIYNCVLQIKLKKNDYDWRNEEIIYIKNFN
jgi:glycosyltransferase involved in cell wall biosynthesis